MCSSTPGRTRGVSLVEAVVFIIVIGIGVAGIATLFNQMTRGSVDPVIRKQALAIAVALMDEIQLQAFTFCDPADANVLTATSATIGPGGCATTLETLGPTGGESRFAIAGTPRFDNVPDYHLFRMGWNSPTSFRDIYNNAIPALANYDVNVNITWPSSDLPATIPTTEQAKIVVTVIEQKTGLTVALQGYRTRYAPNTP